MGGTIHQHEEALRLSSVQTTRMTSELTELKSRYGVNTQELDSYKQRMQKLLGENKALNDEVHSAQENLRLSAGSMAKLLGEFKTVCGENDELKKKLTDYEATFKRYNADNETMINNLTQENTHLKGLIEKKNAEIRSLGGEVNEQQERLRTSAAEFGRLGNELNDYRNKLAAYEGENNTYQQRLKKLMGENKALNDEVHTAQENLRLSAGSMAKLQNEFKAVCGELDDTRRKNA